MFGMGEKKKSKDSYIETATPLREDGLFISLGGSKFLELELFASLLPHIVMGGASKILCVQKIISTRCLCQSRKQKVKFSFQHVRCAQENIERITVVFDLYSNLCFFLSGSVDCEVKMKIWTLSTAQMKIVSNFLQTVNKTLGSTLSFFLLKEVS